MSESSQWQSRIASAYTLIDLFLNFRNIFGSFDNYVSVECVSHFITILISGLSQHPAKSLMAPCSTYHRTLCYLSMMNFSLGTSWKHQHVLKIDRLKEPKSCLGTSLESNFQRAGRELCSASTVGDCLWLNKFFLFPLAISTFRSIALIVSRSSYISALRIMYCVRENHI